MDDFTKIQKKAISNYQNYNVNSEDEWYQVVDNVLDSVIYRVFKQYDRHDAVIVNAGSGGKTYQSKGKLFNLDIVDTNIKQFDNYLVGSVEAMPINDSSVDILICVGSVFNYTDYQKSISEFCRILKKNGVLILEFERSNSGDFLFKPEHHQSAFLQKYDYHGQEHLLMMYNERMIIKTLKNYGFKLNYRKRFHTLSTLLYRFGVHEDKVAKYAKGDWLLKPLSYPLAHNVVLVLTKF